MPDCTGKPWLPVCIVVLILNCCYNRALRNQRPQLDTMTQSTRRLLLLSLPLLAACSATQVPSDAPGITEELPAQQSTPAPEPVETVEIEYGNFSREQLELAMLSEFRGLRGDMPGAAEGYYRLAMDTLDPGILRRAVEYASALGNARAMTALAEQWLDREPGTLEPHLILGFQYLEQGQFIRALPHFEIVLELGGQVDFTALSARTFNLENRQRDVIIERLVAVLENFPGESSIYYALAQIHDQNGATELARQWLTTAREQFGDTPRTVLIDAQIYQNAGAAGQAEALLIEGVQRYPEHRLLRYSLAQLLVQNEKLAEASVQFTELLRREPQDLETLYSLALISLELQQLTMAEAQLRDLLRAGHRRDEANYYLGYLLEQRGEAEQALFHYQQIEQRSNAFLTAQRQIMRLFVELEQFDAANDWVARQSAASSNLAPMFPALQAEALANADYEERAGDVLNEALNQYPDDVDLLFARVLLNERAGRHLLVEQDLRRIIAINPEDARALNHLGYSLTVQTDRYQEALELIERAIDISPDDPAIIDSLGWVQFKLGYLEDALYNLQRAYAAFPDPEVAAHLGEVLWAMGQQAEALYIWQQALETDPQSEHVLDAMERLTEESE
jgi:tetratricopeptide (TPR) repeat protein